MPRALPRPLGKPKGPNRVPPKNLRGENGGEINIYYKNFFKGGWVGREKLTQI